MGQELKHMNLWGTFLFKRPDLESLLCMECHTHHGPVRRILSDSSLFLQCPQRALTRVDTYRYVVKSSNLPSSSKCIAPPSPCCLGQTLRSHSRNLYFLYYLEPTQCHHQIACAAHRFQWSPCWGGGVCVTSIPNWGPGSRRSLFSVKALFSCHLLQEQTYSEGSASTSPAPLCLTRLSCFTIDSMLPFSLWS